MFDPCSGASRLYFVPGASIEQVKSTARIAVPHRFAAARERGCGTMTGIGMFEADRDGLVRHSTEGTPA